MSFDLKAMREKRATLVAEARKLVEDNAGEKWTDEIQKQYDQHEADVKLVDEEIERVQRIMDMEGTAPNAPAGTNGADIAAALASFSATQEDKPVYSNLGEQLQDVVAMTMNNADAPKARDRFQQVVNAATGASTGIDSDGGYLVETDKSKTLLDSAVETGILSSRCSRQPIGAMSDGFEYLEVNDRDRSTGTMGGIQVYRKSEVQEMNSSGKIQLTPRELRLEDMYGMIYVTDRMLRDAVAMAEYTKRNLRKQLAWKLDYEIWEGSGVAQCLGVMNSGLPVSVAKETDQVAKTIVANNVINMLGRFQGDMSKAAWFVNQDCLSQFPKMTIGNQPVFLPGGNMVGAPFGTLLGLPIVPIEFCQTVGSVGDIVLGDFSEYLLIEKGGVEEAESIHVRFKYDEKAFRFITRNNGQPLHDSPITPLHGTNTLSPFVTLAVRG